MENTRKRIYDEEYDAAETIRFNPAQIIQRASRFYDRLTSQEYQDFKISVEGKSNLNELTDDELKYVNRDFKIKGLDTTEILAILQERKMDSKAVLKNAAVATVFEITTDKGTILLGHDKARDQLLISDKLYKDNPNIRNWEKLESGDLANKLRNQGEITEVSFKNDMPELVAIDSIIEKHIEYISHEIDKGIEASQIKDEILALDYKSLKDPNALQGKIIETQDAFNGATKFKVVGGDEQNLTLQKLHGKDNTPYIMNVKTEMTKLMAEATRLTAVLDSKTVMGHNGSDGQTYIGTVNGDKTVDWKPKDAYLEQLEKGKREKLVARLANGDFMLPKIEAIGRIEGGNILYSAEKANGSIVVSTNQKKWHSADRGVGLVMMQQAEQSKGIALVNQKEQHVNILKR